MLNNSQPQKNAFLEHLLSLSSEKDRQELAILRRGLGMPPGQDVRMYPYVVRYLPENERGKYAELVYYLVASLYAFHPSHQEAQTNFGSHMAEALRHASDTAAGERRFTILLNAHIEDLPDYLRQAISLLKAKDVPINWIRLFNDLRSWNHPERYVQRNWANSFWGDLNKAPVESKPTSETN